MPMDHLYVQFVISDSPTSLEMIEKLDQYPGFFLLRLQVLQHDMLVQRYVRIFVCESILINNEIISCLKRLI